MFYYYTTYVVYVVLLYYICIVFLVYLFTVEIDKHSEITEEIHLPAEENILPAEEKNDIIGDDLPADEKNDIGNDLPGNFPAEYYDADDEAEYNIIQI